MGQVQEMVDTRRQNVTLALPTRTIRKAKVLAAKRDTSISGLIAQQIEMLVSEDEQYERAAASAIARMKGGFDLGGAPRVSRDELHER